MRRRQADGPAPKPLPGSKALYTFLAKVVHVIPGMLSLKKLFGQDERFFDLLGLPERKRPKASVEHFIRYLKNLSERADRRRVWTIWRKPAARKNVSVIS